MRRIVGILMSLVLLSGCERYVVEISDVTLSGMYVVDWVTVVEDKGNDTVSFYENGEVFTDSNLYEPFDTIKTNDFNINFESSSFLGEFEMIWLDKPNTPINWKYDSRKSNYSYFEITNNTSYSYGYLRLNYGQHGNNSIKTMVFKIEEDGFEHLKLLSTPYGPYNRQIRLYLTRVGP
jgi:hypothetical protein